MADNAKAKRLLALAVDLIKEAGESIDGGKAANVVKAKAAWSLERREKYLAKKAAGVKKVGRPLRKSGSAKQPRTSDK